MLELGDESSWEPRRMECLLPRSRPRDRSGSEGQSDEARLAD